MSQHYTKLHTKHPSKEEWLSAKPEAAFQIYCRSSIQNIGVHVISHFKNEKLNSSKAPDSPKSRKNFYNLLVWLHSNCIKNKGQDLIGGSSIKNS